MQPNNSLSGQRSVTRHASTGLRNEMQTLDETHTQGGKAWSVIRLVELCFIRFTM